jgi:predicted  nucleic acid-binding Zn-ribbon protein
MIRQGEGSLEAASQRLSQALETLETRLRERPERAADAGSAPAGDGEAEQLRAELEAARERERQLEEAAAEASAALGRAAEQIRAALDEEA